MSKHKNDQQKLAKIAIVISAIAIVLSCVTLYNFYIYATSNDQVNRSSINNYLQSTHKTSQLKHCYENKINPCDLDALVKWNEENPDDTIRLSAPRF